MISRFPYGICYTIRAGCVRLSSSSLYYVPCRLLMDEGAGVVTTPHGVLPKDSH